MQTKTDAERILALGALSAEVVGNSKFDQAIEGLSADPDSWREQLGILADDRVVVVGSTRSALEEQVVLDALAEVAIPQLRVIHAPRHLERVAALMEEAQSRFDEVGKRSEGSKSRYLILDTYGELSQIYCVADVVVIGGGFDDLGGQNLLQPLAHGKPVLHGPHMQNFANVAQAAVSCGASKVCSSSKELGSALQELLRDPERCRQMGKAASELVRGSLGASTRYAEAIQSAATMSE